MSCSKPDESDPFKTLSPWNFSFPFDYYEFQEVAREYLCIHDQLCFFGSLPWWDLFTHPIEDSAGCIYKHWYTPPEECAAWNGHLTRLMLYIKSNPKSLAPALCTSAAGGGQVVCLDYLIKRGCPWDQETVKMAKEHNHPECLDRLYADSHIKPKSKSNPGYRLLVNF